MYNYPSSLKYSWHTGKFTLAELVLKIFPHIDSNLSSEERMKQAIAAANSLMAVAEESRSAETQKEEQKRLQEAKDRYEGFIDKLENRRKELEKQIDSLNRFLSYENAIYIANALKGEIETELLKGGVKKTNAKRALEVVFSSGLLYMHLKKVLVSKIEELEKITQDKTKALGAKSEDFQHIFGSEPTEKKKRK